MSTNECLNHEMLKELCSEIIADNGYYKTTESKNSSRNKKVLALMLSGKEAFRAVTETFKSVKRYELYKTFVETRSSYMVVHSVDNCEFYDLHEFLSDILFQYSKCIVFRALAENVDQSLLSISKNKHLSELHIHRYLYSSLDECDEVVSKILIHTKQVDTFQGNIEVFKIAVKLGKTFENAVLLDEIPDHYYNSNGLYRELLPTCTWMRETVFSRGSSCPFIGKVLQMSTDPKLLGLKALTLGVKDIFYDGDFPDNANDLIKAIIHMESTFPNLEMITITGLTTDTTILENDSDDPEFHEQIQRFAGQTKLFQSRFKSYSGNLKIVISCSIEAEIRGLDYYSDDDLRERLTLAFRDFTVDEDECEEGEIWIAKNETHPLPNLELDINLLAFRTDEPWYHNHAYVQSLMDVLTG